MIGFKLTIRSLVVILVIIVSCKSNTDERFKEVEKYNQLFDKYVKEKRVSEAIALSNLQIRIDTTNPTGYFNKGFVLMSFRESEIENAIVCFKKSIRLIDQYKKNDRYFSIRADAKVYINAFDKTINNNDLPKIDSVVLNYKKLIEKVN